MKNYQVVVRELMVVERAAWWNPRVRRILKAAPLVVMFLLLHSRAARAACSFSPSPDPAVDNFNSGNSLRHAIRLANASGQDCTIHLQAGTYTLTIPNPTTGPHKGQDNTGAYGDLDITDSGHTVTIQGKGAGVSIVNANGIDRAFQVLGGANAAFRNLTIEGGVARDNGSAGILPGTTVPAGGGVLIGGNGHVSFTQVSIQGNKAIGGSGRNGTSVGGSGAPGLAAKGGGIFLYSGTVNLIESKITGNTAAGGAGGAGYNVQCHYLPGGTRLTCPGHSGPGGAGGAGAGGGLYVLSGNTQLSTSTVSGNQSTGGNGGIGGGFAGPSTDGCCASGGSGASAQGGGLFLARGALSLIRTTVSGNFANGGNGNFGGGNITGRGGGNGGSSQGAGIYATSSSINATNSTFFGNAADAGRGGSARFGNNAVGGSGEGGGLYLAGGSISLKGGTLASNQAMAAGAPSGASGTSHGGGIDNASAGLFINTTLIGNNSQNSGNAINGNDVYGAITSSYSLISQTAGATITDDGGNHLNVNPLLDPLGLQFNGGPTQTVALQSGSPAIDVVPVAHCTDLASPPHPLTTDQRGLPRPDLGESVCDVGAYELQDTIAFSHFSGSLQIDPDAGVFNLSGGFTLGTGGIFNPASNSVMFSVGSYTVTVPAGSFVRNNTGYVYQGTVNGIFASVSIKFTSTPGQYVLLARARGVIPATASPVPVFLFNGNSSGITQMTAMFN